MPPGPPTLVHPDQSLSQLLHQTRAQTHSCRFNSGSQSAGLFLTRRHSNQFPPIPRQRFPSRQRGRSCGPTTVPEPSLTEAESRGSGSYLRCSSSRWTQRTAGPEGEDTFLSAAPADTLAEFGQPQQTTRTVHIRQRLQNNVIKLDELQN